VELDKTPLIITFLKKSIILSFLAIATGCATANKMPIGQPSENLDLSSKALVFGKLSVKNEVKPNYQPDLISMAIKKDGKLKAFTEPLQNKSSEKHGKEYIYSFEVEPGTTEVNIARFLSQKLLIVGSAQLRIQKDVTLQAGEIAYLGHLFTKVVKPTDPTQPKAGHRLPLLDQAVSGFASNTFNVKLENNFEDDVSDLKENYPFFADKDIKDMTWENYVHPKFRNKDGDE